MIALEGVSKRFGDGFAVRDLTLTVSEGELLVLVGESGCGKTTMLDLCAGIRVPDRGAVVADGFAWHEHDDASRRRRRLSEVGLVFQEFELLDHLTVEENVLLPYLIHPALPLDDRARARARALAGELGIAALLPRRPRQLSQGERQRVAIGRALVTEPSLVLADEPTGNLDQQTSLEIHDLLVQLNEETGITFVIATHNPILAARMNRHLRVEAAQIVEAPSPVGVAT